MLLRRQRIFSVKNEIDSHDLPVELVVAVATRVLVKVTLMIIFGGVESSCLLQSGHDRLLEFFRALKVCHEFLGLILLVSRVVENNRAVLSSYDTRLVRFGGQKLGDVVSVIEHGALTKKLIPSCKFGLCVVYLPLSLPCLFRVVGLCIRKNKVNKSLYLTSEGSNSTCTTSAWPVSPSQTSLSVEIWSVSADEKRKLQNSPNSSITFGNLVLNVI